MLWSEPWGQIEILAANGYSVSDEHAEADSFGSDLRAEGAGSDAVINAIVRSTGVDVADPFAVAKLGSKAMVQEVLGERPWDSQWTAGKLANYEKAKAKAHRYFNARVGLGYSTSAITEAAEQSVSSMTGLVASDYVKKMVYGYGSVDYDSTFGGTGVNRTLAMHFDGGGEYLADMIANGSGDLFMGVYEFSHEVMLGLTSQRAKAGKGRIQVYTDPLAMTAGKNQHVMVHRALSAMEGVEYNANLLDSSEGTAGWFKENSGDFNARLWLESPQAYLQDPTDEEGAAFWKKWNHEHYKLFTVGMDRLSTLDRLKSGTAWDHREALRESRLKGGPSTIEGLQDEARQGIRFMLGSANVTRGAMGSVATRGGAYASGRGVNVENFYTMDFSAVESGRVDRGFFDYITRAAYEAQEAIAGRTMGPEPMVFNAAGRGGYTSGIFNNNAFVNQVTSMLETVAKQSWRGRAEVTVMINRLSDISENNAMLALLQNTLAHAGDVNNLRINLVLGKAHSEDDKRVRAAADAILESLSPEHRQAVRLVQNANVGIHSKSFGARYVDAQGREQSWVTAGSTNLNDSGLLGDYGHGAAFRNLSVIAHSQEDQGAIASYDLMSQFANLSRYTASSQAGTGGPLGYSADQLEQLAVKYGVRRDNVTFQQADGQLSSIQFRVGGRLKAGSVGHFELGSLMTLTAAAPTADSIQKGFGFEGQLWVQELNKFVSPTAGIYQREFGDVGAAPGQDKPFSAMETLVAGVAGANASAERALAAIEARFGAEYLSRMMGSTYLRSRLKHRIREQVRATFENFQGYELGTPAYGGKGHGMVGMNMVHGPDGEARLDLSRSVGASPERVYASSHYGRGDSVRGGKLGLPNFPHFFTAGGLSKFKSGSEASAATFYGMDALSSLSVGARRPGDEANDDNLLLMPVTKLAQLPQRIQTLLSARNLNPMRREDDVHAFEAIGASEKGVGRSRFVAEGQVRTGIKGVGFLGLGMVGDNAYVTAESIEGFFVKNESFRKTFKVSGQAQDPIHLLTKQMEQLSGLEGTGVVRLGDEDRFYLSYEALEKMGHQLDVAQLNVDGGLHQIIQTVDTNTQRTPGMGLVLDLRAGVGTTVTRAGNDHSVTITGYSTRELTSGDRSMIGVKAPLLLIQEQSRLLQQAKVAANVADRDLYKRFGLDQANLMFGEGVIKSGEALMETGLRVIEDDVAMRQYLDHFRTQARAASPSAWTEKDNKLGLVKDLRFLMGRLKGLVEDEATRKAFGLLEEKLKDAKSIDHVVKLMEHRFHQTRTYLSNQDHVVSLQNNADHAGAAALAMGIHMMYWLDKVNPANIQTFGGNKSTSYYGHLNETMAGASDQQLMGLVPIFTTLSVNAASQAFSSRDRVRFLNYHAGGYTDAIFDLMATSPLMQEKVAGYRELLEIGIFGMHGKDALYVDATKQSLLSSFVAGVHEVTGRDGAKGSAFGAAVQYEQRSRRIVSQDFSAWGSGDGNATSLSQQGNAIAQVLEARRKALMLGEAHKAYISDPTNRDYRAEGGVANNAVQDLFTSLEKGGVGSVALLIPEIGRYENDGKGVVFKTDGTVSGGGEAVVVWRQVNLVNPAHAKTTGSFEDFSSDVMRHQEKVLKLMKVVQKLDIRDGKLVANSMSSEDREEYEQLLQSMGSYQDAVRDLVASDLQKYYGGQLSLYGHNAVIGTAPEVGTSEMVLDRLVWEDMRGEIAKEILSSIQEAGNQQHATGGDGVHHVNDVIENMLSEGVDRVHKSKGMPEGWRTSRNRLKAIREKEKALQSEIDANRQIRNELSEGLKGLRQTKETIGAAKDQMAELQARLDRLKWSAQALENRNAVVRQELLDLRTEQKALRSRKKSLRDELKATFQNGPKPTVGGNTPRTVLEAHQAKIMKLQHELDVTTQALGQALPEDVIGDANWREYLRKNNLEDHLSPRGTHLLPKGYTPVNERVVSAEAAAQDSAEALRKSMGALRGEQEKVQQEYNKQKNYVVQTRRQVKKTEQELEKAIPPEIRNRMDNPGNPHITSALGKAVRELDAEARNLREHLKNLREEANVYAKSRPAYLDLQGIEALEWLLDNDMDFRRQYVSGVMQRAGAPFGPNGVVAVRDVLTTEEYNARNPAVRLAERKYGRGVYFNVGAMAFNLGDFDGDTGSVSYLQGYAALKAKEKMGTLGPDDIRRLKKAERMLSTTTEEVSFQFARSYTGLTSIFDDNLLYNTGGLNASEKRARIEQLQDLNEAATVKFNALSGSARSLSFNGLDLDFNGISRNTSAAAALLFDGDEAKATEWVMHRARLAYGHSLSQAGNAYVQAMQESHASVHNWMATQRARGFEGSDSQLYAAFFKQGASGVAVRGLLKAAESLTKHDTRFFSDEDARKFGLEANNELQALSSNQLAGFFMATSFASSVVMARVYEVVHAMDQKVANRYYGAARAALLDIGQNLEGHNLVTGMTSGLGTAAADVLKSIADGDVATLQAQLDAAVRTQDGRVDAFQAAVELAGRDVSDDVRGNIIRTVSRVRELENEGERRRGQMLTLQQIAREAIKPKGAMDSLRQAKMSLFSDVNFETMSPDERLKVIQSRLSDPQAVADVFEIVRNQPRMRGLETLHALVTGKGFLDDDAPVLQMTLKGEGGRTWDDVYRAVRDMLRDYRSGEVETLAKRMAHASDDERQKLLTDGFAAEAKDLVLTAEEAGYIRRETEERVKKADEPLTTRERENLDLELRMKVLSERQVASEAIELVNMASASRGYYYDRTAYANALNEDDSGFVDRAKFYESAGRMGTQQKHQVISSVFMRGQFKSADGIQLALTDIFEEYKSAYELLVVDGKTAEEARAEVIKRVRREATASSMTDAYADFTVDAFTKYMEGGRDVVSSLKKASESGLEVAQKNGVRLVKDLEMGLGVLQDWHLSTISKTEAEMNGLDDVAKAKHEADAKAHRQEVLDAFAEAKKTLQETLAGRGAQQQADGLMSADDITKAQSAVDKLVTQFGLDESLLAKSLAETTVKSVNAAEGAAHAGKPKNPGSVTGDDAAARKYVAARAQLADVAAIASAFKLHEGPTTPKAERVADYTIGKVEGVLSSFMERTGKSSYMTAVLGSFVPSAVEKFANLGLTTYTESWWAKAGGVLADGLTGMVMGSDPREGLRDTMRKREDSERWMNAAISVGSQFAGMGATLLASDIAARAMTKKAVLAMSEAHTGGDNVQIQKAAEHLKRTEFKAKAGAALAGNAAAALATMGAAWLGQALATKLGFSGPRGAFKEQLNYALTGDASNEVADEFQDLSSLGFDNDDVDDEGVVTIRDENGNVIEQSFYRVSWAAREASDDSNMGILEAGLDTYVGEAGYDGNAASFAGF